MKRRYPRVLGGVMLGGLLGLSLQLGAQNMCPNPSFETAGWAQANNGSADWLTASNVFGNQTPRTGTRMMGEAFGSQNQSEFREYIKCTLTAPMTIGSAYYLEMWVSLSDIYGTYACNHHGMALTTTDPYYAFSYGPIPLTPQVQSLTPLTSQTTWMQVSGTITATQAFRYMTIGNFYNDGSTTFQFVGGNSFTYGYYFMDDILVQPAVILGSEFLTFEATTLDRNVDLAWSVPSSSEGKIFEVQRRTQGGEWAQVGNLRMEDHPTGQFSYRDESAPFQVPLQYRILQNDANGNIHYSETREALVASNGIGQLVGIYPNLVASGHPLQVEYLMRAAGGLLKVTIQDMAGRLLWQQDYEAQGGTNRFWATPGALAAGSYLLVVEGEGKRHTAKFQVAQ